MTIRCHFDHPRRSFLTLASVLVAGVTAFLLGISGGLAALTGGGMGGAVAAAPDGPVSGFGGGAAANLVTEFKGTLKDAHGNVLTVTREDGVECLVQFPDEITSLNFVATALPAYLRRGMPVRFATVLGPTGVPVSPVDKLEIFSPLSPQVVPHSQSTRFTPGVQASDRKARPRGAPLTGNVDVVGNLVMLTPQGGLAVQAGEIPVQTMISPDAKLEIRLNNLSLAQPGDEVSVAGFYQPTDETKVKASRIIITTDRVYGAEPPQKVRGRGGKGKRSAVSPEAEAEAAAADASDG